MAIIFDGRKFAAEKEKTLSNRVFGLKSRGVHPKLASILVGNDPAGELYVTLKKKAGERIGVEVNIYLIKKDSNLEDLLLLIKILNEDETVNGIMIQMPILGKLGEAKGKIVDSIDPDKDVDGLKDDSQFLHPTSKAVMDILRLACREQPCKVAAVIGATGMVGKPLVRKLHEEGFEVIECNSKTEDLKTETLKGDSVISVTGIPGLIKGDMVKTGAIVIDVGSPKGDVDFPEVSKKASFITPVPGGVGPVTISCLLENLIASCA